jgi:hypothetical protein
MIDGNILEMTSMKNDEVFLDESINTNMKKYYAKLYDIKLYSITCQIFIKIILSIVY